MTIYVVEELTTHDGWVPVDGAPFFFSRKRVEDLVVLMKKCGEYRVAEYKREDV